MKIAVDDLRIFVRGRVGGAVRFTDIAEITAEKLDKVSYDELFLIVRSKVGEAIILGEMDVGFAEVEQALTSRLEGFPEDWRGVAEERSAGIRVRIWPTSSKVG